MKKLLLLPIALLTVLGCSSENADTGDSGIEKMPVSNKAGSNPALNNPNMPESAKAAIGGGK